VRQNRPRPGTIKRILSILKSGEGFLIFPEGTRSINGRLLRGNPGLGMLASVASVPVIPTLIVGTEKALPFGARWIRLEKIQIQFGKPVFPVPVEKNRDRRQTYQALTDKVMKRIEGLQKNKDLENRAERDTL
jgi:1-acyl-sn-glycerol-3-phosphate acyltransferase